MTIKYTEIETINGNTVIQADMGDGRILHIPTDPANSDYQAYLKRDEAETI